MTATLVKPESVTINAELQSMVERLAAATQMYGYDISAEFNPLSSVKDFESGHSCSIVKEDSFAPEVDVILAELASLCAALEIAVHVEFRPKVDFGDKSFTRRAFSCFIAPCPPSPSCFVVC